MKISRFVFMWRIFRFNAIEESAAFGERGDGHPKDSCHVPAGTGDKSENGSGAGNMSSSDAHEIMIAAE